MALYHGYLRWDYGFVLLNSNPNDLSSHFTSCINIQLVSTELLDGLHASPQHALALHKDIRSCHSLGMHFATFAGSDMEALEPVAELIAEREKDGGVGDWMDEGGFGVIDVGETAVVAVGRNDSS